MSDVFERLEQATAITDLSEVQAWLCGWGDYSRNGAHTGLGYQSPMARLICNNVQQSTRPVMFNMDDEAYYSMIERALGVMRSSNNAKRVMQASLIKRYYMYGMSYRRLSKTLVSAFEHGKDSTKICHVRKVQHHLADAERFIYNFILDKSK